MPTPKHVTSTILDFPKKEPSDPLINIDEAVRVTHPDDRLHTVTPAEIMRPPPLLAHVLAVEKKRELTPSTSSSSLQVSTSPEEARRALEVVVSFIEQQSAGFLDFQESIIHSVRLLSLSPSRNTQDGQYPISKSDRDFQHHRCPQIIRKPSTVWIMDM